MKHPVSDGVGRMNLGVSLLCEGIVEGDLFGRVNALRGAIAVPAPSLSQQAAKPVSRLGPDGLQSTIAGEHQ